MILRRVIITLMACVAILYASLGWQSAHETRWSSSTVAPAGAPVISPRRTPELTASVSSDAQTRAVAARALGSAGAPACVDIWREGRNVYSAQPTTPMTPASTAKLFTAVTALGVMGANARATTSVRASSVDRGVVKGPLALVGGGDPLLFTSQYQRDQGFRQDFHTPFESLADKVVAEGVRVVEGGVMGDERRFDNIRAVPTWEPSYSQSGEVGPIGALLVDQGIARTAGTPQRVPDPALHAAAVFTDLLRARGVDVRGGPTTGIASERDDTVASLDSRPTRDAVAQMLIESDNTTAEMLLKQIGYEKSEQGTTRAGLEAVRETLAGKGIDTANLRLADGSGLDRSDRSTCRMLGEVMREADPDGIVGASLARAGESGTLRERMRGTPAQGRVQAKTGTLNGVSGLVGWARPQDKAPLSFAFLVNGAGAETARAAEDRLAVSLATIPPVASASAYSPDPVPK